MAIKADPPDFIDSGSYNVTDVSGWGKAVTGLAIGTALVTVALGVGFSGGRAGSNRLTQATGLGSATSDGATITVN